MEIELLFIWMWFNSISAIYYLIKYPFKDQMNAPSRIILAYMMTGTFWLLWLMTKVGNKFGVFSNK